MIDRTKIGQMGDHGIDNDNKVSNNKKEKNRNCGSVAGVGVALQNGVPLLVIYLLLLLVLVVHGGCRSNWRSLSGFAG